MDIATGVTQAGIAAGSAVIGALIGGLMTSRGATKQWQRDLLRARRDRSHQAAQRLLIAVARMEAAVVEWAADHDAAALGASFNAFSLTTVAENPFLIDDNVANRVRAHVEFTAVFAAIARQGDIPAPMTEAVRRHADAVVSALEAHIADKPLPAYRELPLGRAAELMAWRPE